MSQFSEKYVVDADTVLDPTRSIQIKQRAKYPPRYCVVYKRQVLEVFPNRSNLFQTLAIFAYIVSVTAGGYIGLLHLGGRSIEMTKAIEDGPAFSLFLENESGSSRSLGGHRASRGPNSDERESNETGKYQAEGGSAATNNQPSLLAKEATTPLGLNVAGPSRKRDKLSQADGAESEKGVTFK
ncbi:hypothetical protein HDU96_009104 [Phlyctochytrium bullatum]|nr:hypothetical protein HDU96_009104 [Phlyctochytrium bullatum]